MSIGITGRTSAGDGTVQRNDRAMAADEEADLCQSAADRTIRVAFADIETQTVM